MIKKISLLMLLFFISSVALAQEEEAEEEKKQYVWQGHQLQLTISGDMPFWEDGWLSMFGSLTYFQVPQNEEELTLTYLGPAFTVTDWFWIAPFVGVAGNWTEDGKDAAIASLWTEFSPSDFVIFGEADMIYNNDIIDFYNYVSFDYCLNDNNFGVQEEMVNELIMFGPHYGLTSGIFHFEAQYYMGFQEENLGHTVRLVGSISFSEEEE